MKKILAITLILVVLLSFVTLSSATSTDHEPIFDGTDLIAATDVDMGTIPVLNESRTFDKQAQLNEIYNRLLTSFIKYLQYISEIEIVIFGHSW